MARTADWMSLMTMPWQIAKTMTAWAETMVAMQAVIGARSLIILEAMADPTKAGHPELSRMVNEKFDAFGRSAKSVEIDGRHLNRLWSRQFRTLSRGGPLGFAEGWAILEAALAATVTLTGLPGRSLRPIHQRVTGNAARLAHRSRTS